MQRFYLPPDETRADVLTLSDREAHHALNVVRLRPGEIVMVLNGEGQRLTCETVELGRRAVRLRVTGREVLPGRSWPITLFQAIPKGKAFDTIVQKATELGARRIVPLVTRRVVSQIEPDRHAAKLEHWRAIAIESIKQCGSPWLPDITAPTSLEDCLVARESAALSLVASLRANARHPWRLLEDAMSATAGKPGVSPFLGWAGGRFHRRRTGCDRGGWGSAHDVGHSRATRGHSGDLRVGGDWLCHPAPAMLRGYSRTAR